MPRGVQFWRYFALRSIFIIISVQTPKPDRKSVGGGAGGVGESLLCHETGVIVGENAGKKAAALSFACGLHM